MLAVLNQRVASPSQLSGELDEPIGNVSYHMRTLTELGMVELVRTEPRRGAVEHYYRAIERPHLPAQDWATLPAVDPADIHRRHRSRGRSTTSRARSSAAASSVTARG